MQLMVVVLGAGWGAVGGFAASRAPWRRWIGEEPAPAAATPGEPAVEGVAFGQDTAPAAVPAATEGEWGRPGRGRLLPVLGAVVGGGIAQAAGARPETAVWLALVPVALLLAVTDLAVRRLPDVLTLPAAAGTALLLGAAALLPGHQGSWPRALLAAAVLAVAYFFLMLVNPSGMGFGDVKLAPTLGLVLGWYGWPYVFAGTFLAFTLGALTAGALLLARRATRKTALPFGPFMLLGALGALFLALR